MGVVLVFYGGVLDKMFFLFCVGVGGVVGNGWQWMSWIYLDDLVNMYVWVFENKKVQGVFNVVVFEFVMNKKFLCLLVIVLGCFLGLLIFKVVLKVIFGEFVEVLMVL